MDEALYRQTQTAKRLFGPSATITGRMGSGVAPGVVEIHVDGRRLGVGKTFAQALEYATRNAVRPATAPASCDCPIKCRVCRCVGVA